ncbi:MAG: nucleotidyltransferase domain-containing protein [Planctomycetota bacterium]
MDAEAVIARVQPILAAHQGLVAAYLFGSVARGTAKASSDVDIAVLYAERPPSVLGSPPMKLEGALERELRCAVQVVCLNVAPPDLAIRVLRGGRLILERDRAARIRFEVNLRNVFWDLEPVLKLCRKR